MLNFHPDNILINNLWENVSFFTLINFKHILENGKRNRYAFLSIDYSQLRIVFIYIRSNLHGIH